MCGGPDGADLEPPRAARIPGLSPLNPDRGRLSARQAAEHAVRAVTDPKQSATAPGGTPLRTAPGAAEGTSRGEG